VKQLAVRVAIVLVATSLAAGLCAVNATALARDRTVQPRELKQVTDWRTRFFSVAWTLLKSKSARPAEKAALTQYGLPYGCAHGWIPRYFCPSQRPTYGIGYSVYASTPVWTESGAVYSYPLPLYTPLKLLCYTAGVTHSIGNLTSNLYYQLPNGGYVNDAWIYTGTNNVIPGVPHC
jgi:hypothetical protein